MKSYAKKWLRDAPATDKAAVVKIVASNASEARMLGELHEAVNNGDGFEALLLLSMALREGRLSPEKRLQLEAIIDELTWPHSPRLW